MSNTRCSVDHCPNKTGKLDTSVSLFSIPVDESTLEKWIKTTDYSWKAGAKVCSEHFADDDLFITKNNGVRLKKGAIPTIPVEYLDEPTSPQEPMPKKPRYTIIRKSVAKNVNPNATVATATPTLSPETPLKRKIIVKRSSIMDASASTPIEIVGRRAIGSPTAVASSSPNDSTVQFHDQFLGFVKQKNDEPQPVAVKSRSKPKSIVNVLEDYSDAEDEKDDQLLQLLHEKIDRLESSMGNVMEEIRSIRNDLILVTKKPPSVKKVISKPVQDITVSTAPPKPIIDAKVASKITPSTVVTKLTARNSTKISQNDAKNKTFSEMISCFPIDVSEFLDLNKLCSENERMRQFMLARFDACTETELTKFVYHNLKSVVIESNLRVLSWNRPNNCGVPAIKDCPIVQLLQESAQRKIKSTSAAAAETAIKLFFLKK